MLQNCTTYKILGVFFINPKKKFNLKDISRLSKIAHTSVKNELEKLIKQKLIIKEIEIRGKRKFPIYFSNINEKFLGLKKMHNEYAIKQSGLIPYLRAQLMPNLIILFGSFSRGEDIEESDIDLFIESKQKEIELNKFEEILHHKINLIFKPNINLLKKEFLNNILNGVILYGIIELK
jgi:predicted nucleotidyltransferase